MGVAVGLAAHEQRQRDVLLCGQARDELEVLEDDPQPNAPVGKALGLGESCEVTTVKPHAA